MQIQLVGVLAVLLACTIGSSSAIKCYQCTTITDGDSCGDPFKSGTQVDNCQQCAKAKYKVGGNQVVARVCNTVSSGSNGCQSGSYQGVEADMCNCDGDLCNTSSHVTVSMATSLVAGLFVLLVKKLL